MSLVHPREGEGEGESKTLLKNFFYIHQGIPFSVPVKHDL